MNICLYGSGSRKTDKIYTNEAYKLGAKIANENHTLVFGGGDTGMMGACAAGVHDNNGKSVGIAPEWIGNFEPLCKYCSEFIYVDSMDERKQKFLENSDAFIISPGGIGTLDEFFEIITLKQLGQSKKPLVLYNINGYFEPLRALLQNCVDGGFMPQATVDMCFFSDDFDAIIDHIENYVHPEADITRLRNITQ
jgi:uncharacterized protein (TIGR00730 family)